MSVIQLFFIEGIVLGTVFGAGACLFMWIWDIRDHRKKAETEKVEAYENGRREAYEWRLHEMELAEMAIDMIQADIEEIRNGNNR